MEPITHDQFRETLMAAASQHDIRYTDSYSLTVRWEADDTNAAQDAVHFQSILSIFKLPEARELVISAQDKTPGWTIQHEMQQVLHAANKNPGRSVVIVHYAGHGALDEEEDLILAGGSKNFSAERFMISLTLEKQQLLQATSKVDVLFILDCCYSYAACREPKATGRVVEIIAASDDTSPLANAPPRNTLTNKLAGELRHRQRAGHQFVEFADVIQTLRGRENAVKKPAHWLKLGARSICLPFEGPLHPSQIPPTIRAVFNVHIANNISQQELDRFVNWIRTLPPYADIVLEGVFQTESMVLILSSAAAVFSKLKNMKGYRLITETIGHNMIARHQSPATYAPTKKENTPFGKPIR